MGRHSKLPIAAAIVGLAAGFLLKSGASANPAVYEVGSDPAVGFNLISWWNFGASGAATWQNAVQSVYDAGFRSVSISPVRYVTVGTGVIAATSTKGPELSHIAAGVARAKSLGMRVMLNPFVEPENFSMWRGQYNPAPGSAESNQFWGDYQSYLVQVAQIANAYQVDGMTVGTEYNALDGNVGNNAKWSAAINAVDAVYSGPLGYAANWDHYNHSNVRDAIWEHAAIDFIGIDSYFTGMVTNSQSDGSGTYPNPAFISTMTNAWNNKLNNEILPFAAARKGGAGMPVAFTEIGYLPYNRTARTPQNSSGQPVDTGEQIMAFNGLMNALDHRGNVFRSVDVWQWGMPGNDGSLWNMDTTLPAGQPNNVPVAQWLAQFVGTGVLPMAGDYNRDGNVDAADYLVWRKTSGQFVLQFSGADGNGSGSIDQADYAFWRSQFGSASGGASAPGSIPEPCAIGLLFVAAWARCRLWRRRT